ncbi:potassium transporter TrkG [Candidatus Nitrosocosmicus hydrocola]|uniref:potassium transporter TrkG n=1 Tax=Candidatus Nitrosocosmicus hydrocola TaxID=1826872 RepID=UPI0011E5B05B|nr:potassium transporter TrkG [Candidatus Nitrosocosmicus hydrocola]
MVTKALDRSVLSYIHHQIIILDQDMDSATAVKRMHEVNAETIIVKNKNDEHIGIITDSDILDKIVMRGEDSDTISIKTIMSSPIITISAKASVRQALELMRLNAIKRVPITDNIHILGIVTQEGLANTIRTSVLEQTFRPYRIVMREHYKPIMSNLGFILQFAGFLFIGPAVLAALMEEPNSAVGIFLCIVCMSITGFVLNSYGERMPMNLKQASLLMVSSFVLLSFFGSIPYVYVNPFASEDFHILFINSFFESASGFTTTGLSFISFPEELPKSFDLYRSYTQYIGGLSFVYLIVAFFYPERKLMHIRGLIGGGNLKVRQLILTISVIFTAYAIGLTFLLYLSGQIDILFSLTLVFSTVTGGGFVPSSTALDSENTLALTTLVIGMVISALPFVFHYAVFSKKVHTTRVRPELILYAGIITIGVIVFYFILYNPSVQEDLMASVFHVISAATNSGFQFISISQLSFESKLVLMIVMLIGGTAFSTAGGIKVGRILHIIQKLLGKNFTSDSSGGSISAVASPYNKKYIITTESKPLNSKEEKIMNETLYVIFLFIGVSLITGTIISYMDKKNFLDSLFDSVSALTTTGLSTGITSVYMDPISKIVLIINMIVGRFEIITIIYLFLNISKKLHLLH